MTNSTFLRPDLLHILFTHSKGAKFAGGPESIQIKDLLLIKLLTRWSVSKTPNELVLNFSYVEFANLLKSYATIFDVVRSRWGLASKSAVRTTTLVPVSRDVSTIDAEPIQTPTAPAIGGRATSPLVLFPNLTYLATHEKRGFESIMAPNGPLDS